MPAPLIIGSAIAGGASLLSGLLNKGNDITQVPLETPEQTRARQYLMDFVTSGGKSVGYNAGEKYSGPLGNYSMTPVETTGQSQLMNMLSSSNPSYLSGAGSVLDNLFSGAYDPNAGGVYKGLTAGIDINTQDALNQSKRNASYAGNLYSTDAYRTQGKILSDSAAAKSSILGGLYQNYTNQQLQGVGQAGNLSSTMQGLDLSKIGAAYQYGSLPRSLNTAQDQAAYQEWLRARSDLLTPVQTAGTVLGSTPQYGVPSIPTANPWQGVLQNLAQYGAMYGIAGGK